MCFSVVVVFPSSVRLSRRPPSSKTNPLCGAPRTSRWQPGKKTKKNLTILFHLCAMLQPGELGPSSLCSDGLQGGGARRVRDIVQHTGEWVFFVKAILNIRNLALNIKRFPQKTWVFLRTKLSLFIKLYSYALYFPWQDSYLAFHFSSWHSCPTTSSVLMAQAAAAALRDTRNMLLVKRPWKWTDSKFFVELWTREKRNVRKTVTNLCIDTMLQFDFDFDFDSSPAQFVQKAPSMKTGLRDP